MRGLVVELSRCNGEDPGQRGKPHGGAFEICRVIRADHPSLAGHFPGKPIVPGVVILDEITAALREWREGYRISAIPAVKFLLPLQPEQPFAIRLNGAGNKIDFCCRVEGRVVVEGHLEITRSED